MHKAKALSFTFLALASAQTSTISLDVQSTAPAKAAVVDPTFPAFAFEQRSFYLYFNSSRTPNQFSLNLISNVVHRTNGSTVIRVGGTSLDDSYYDPQQEEPIHYPPGDRNQGIIHNLTFGPSFFSAFHTIPSTKYIFDIPFATDNKSNSTEWAKAGYQNIGPDRIEALELGNEVNLYGSKARKDQNWGPRSYVTQWSSWTSSISSALGLPDSFKIWDALTYSAGATPPWTTNQTFTSGNLSAYTDRISTCSLHYYQARFPSDSSTLSSLFLNHTFTTSQMQVFADAVGFLHEYNTTHHQHIPLDLAEVGPSIGLSKDKSDRIQGSFGMALWVSDMLLHAMSIGVRRVNYQQIIGASLSLWQPIPWQGEAPHVRPSYYGLVFAGGFVGEEGVRVREIEVGQGKGERLSAYGAWSGEGEENLLRVAVVNLEEWNLGSGLNRTAVRAQFKAPEGWERVEVSRLESHTGANDSKEDNISFAGMTYTFGNMGKGEQRGGGKETVMVNNGNVTVDVNASEAVLIAKAN